MTPDDTTDFRVVMGALYVAYDKEPDETQMLIYWKTLKDLGLEELQQAALQWTKTEKWFPKPSDLRGQVFMVRHGVQAARDAALLSQPAGVEDHCEDCRDTGWHLGECGVAPCQCRTTNPVYQRKLAQQRASLGEAGETHEQATKVLEAVKDFKQLQSGD